MTVRIHIHRKTADADLNLTVSQKQSLIKDFLIKTETRDRMEAEKFLRAKSWDLDRAVQAWERADRTKDGKVTDAVSPEVHEVGRMLEMNGGMSRLGEMGTGLILGRYTPKQCISVCRSVIKDMEQKAVNLKVALTKLESLK